MELKEGMYVRIKNKVGYCVIGKIENINDFREPLMKYCIDIQSNDFIFIPEEIITKASNNIIDLIEVGDYVNGFRVDEIGEYHSIKTDTVETYAKVNCSALLNCFYKEDIKSIVTKEQFEAMKYEIS